MPKTYGKLRLEDGYWKVEALPHVMIEIKRLFPRINKSTYGVVKIRDSQEVCRNLEWFCSRYPLINQNEEELRAGSERYRQQQESLETIIGPNYVPTSIPLARPLRDYQSQAVELQWATNSLLLADVGGLGKTPTSLGVLTRSERLPALVVCQPTIAFQWAKEQIPKFLPSAKVHIIKSRKIYDLPPADIYIISYSKLAAWGDYFTSRTIPIQTVIYDEVQELRRPDSDKYRAARALADVIPSRMGLSATPIYNYGEEFYPVLDVLRPGCLGDRSEFLREWCNYIGDHAVISDTAAFQSYLRENHVMLARTRKDVGRELPPLSKIVHVIEHDQKALDAIKDDATALARQILHGTFVERGQAARQFDLKMRQATGIAKAPFAAQFIRMIAEREKVLVFAWHREVYDILNEELKDLKPVMWTGSESEGQKQDAKTKFMGTESNIMLMSTRSSAGVDGLQDVCQVVVFIELDWSEGVHNQCIWRVQRERADGVENKTTAFYLLSDSGSDPVISRILGIKSSQLDGVIGNAEMEIDESEETKASRIRSLAEEYLKKHHDEHSHTQGADSSLRQEKESVFCGGQGEGDAGSRTEVAGLSQSRDEAPGPV